MPGDLKIVISSSPTTRKKARYVLNTFLVALGISHTFGDLDEDSDAVPQIVYCQQVEHWQHLSKAVIIQESPLIRGRMWDDQTLANKITWNAREFFGKETQVLGPVDSQVRGGISILSERSLVIINSDIIMSAFFFLSRAEEYWISDRDRAERFPYRSSTFPSLNWSGIPMVNQYLDIMSRSLAEAGILSGTEQESKRPWPGNKQFALCLSHDVDVLRRSVLGRIKGLTTLTITKQSSKLDRSKAGTVKALDYLLNSEPFWLFDDIVKIEEVYSAESTFFFASAPGSAEDPQYAASEPKLRALIHRLKDFGKEIGLHGSYHSFSDGAMLSSQKEQLELVSGPVRGSRQHCLRLDVGITFPLYEGLGFDYDSTLGFAEVEGYRSGFTFPYHPYNLVEDRPYNFTEIPLTVMDQTLFAYRKLSADGAWDAVKRQLEIAHDTTGCCTLLWHNHFFDECYAPGYRQVYIQALDWASTHGAWITSCGRVATWWDTKRESKADGAI